ncbi:MAG: FAD-binding protein [Ferruginibacter sp.]
MPDYSRKKFVQQVALTGMALLMQRVEAFSKNAKYKFSERSSEDVVYYEKNSAEYETLRKGFNKRINKYPKVIALCQNTNGVVEAIQYAKRNTLKLTVKSGGHCMEGFSCIDEGMLINLSLLNKIEWVDKNSISVEPACTLKTIYEMLIPNGKYLPGGSCQTVAIGGLTLGGGYGLMSRNFGLTCDSLIEATIVSADGKIINTKDDAELLWALKGGGNGNFGVVTQMKFKVYAAPATMQSYKFRNRNPDTNIAIQTCKQWFEACKTLPDSCFSAFIFNGRTTYILLTNIGKQNPSVSNFIKSFQATSTKFSQGKRLPLGQALKAYYAEANPITFKNASAGLYKSFDDIEPVLEAVFTLIKQKPGILYQVNTLGGKIQSAEAEQNSSFAHRDCFYFSELQAYWQSAASTNGFLNQFELIQQQFANAGVKAQYRNYPDINFKAWPQLYYGKNLDRLIAVKNKYDAAKIFGGPQTLG